MTKISYFHVELDAASKWVNVPGCVVWYYRPKEDNPAAWTDRGTRPADAESAMVASTADALTDAVFIASVERKDPIPPPPRPPRIFARSTYLSDPAVATFFKAEDRELTFDVVAAPTLAATGIEPAQPATALTPEERASHALVIGISNYQHVRKLPPTRDAEDVARLLTDPERGGYPLSQVTVLTEEAATRTGILAALELLAARAATSSRVLVYFSGHGGSANGEYYLVPSDGKWATQAEVAATSISSTELNERLGRIAAAQVTVVLDCCRASGIAAADLVGLTPDRSALTDPADESQFTTLTSGKGRSVLAGSLAQGSSYVLGGARNGVFTRHLLAGLEKAAGTAGVVRVFDLYEYVEQQVRAEMPAQQPLFKAALRENYALVRYPDEAFVLPPRTDALEYDAFISFEESQRAWVEKTLVPGLRKLGVKVSLEADYGLGEAWVDEAARVVESSRFTIAVITPAYFTSGFRAYQQVLALHLTAETGRSRFIPILRGATTLPISVRARVGWALDATSEPDFGAALKRLALAVRKPL